MIARSAVLSRRTLSSPAREILQRLNIEPGGCVKGIYNGNWREGSGSTMQSTDKTTGEVLAHVASAGAEDVRETIAKANEALEEWRMVPAWKRGEVLRHIRSRWAENIEDLGSLVSLETGKMKSEGIGEVQEAIRIAAEAVGVPSQLKPIVLLPNKLPEFSHIKDPVPHGLVGVISDSDVPCAHFGFNFSLSFVSGNSTIWAPSRTTPLVSIAMTRLIASVLKENALPGAIASLVCGGPESGKALVYSKAWQVLSFWGSEAAGKQFTAHLGYSIVYGEPESGNSLYSKIRGSVLELGFNHDPVVMPHAPLYSAVRAVVNRALGTAKGRCTTTRRLYLHKSIAKDFLVALKVAYAHFVSVKDFVSQPDEDDPFPEDPPPEPLYSKAAIFRFGTLIDQALKEGGQLLFGGRKHDAKTEGFYVESAIIVMEDGKELPPVTQLHCGASILYVTTFDTLDEAIALNNGVGQGLSANIRMPDVRWAFDFPDPEFPMALYTFVNVHTPISGVENAAGSKGKTDTAWMREAVEQHWNKFSFWQLKKRYESEI